MHEKTNGYYWIADENEMDENYAYMINMVYNKENVEINSFLKWAGFSVRCIKD